MADRNVANTATLDTLRTTYNSTAADVGDITSVTGASGVIASATDIVEAIDFDEHRSNRYQNRCNDF